MKKNYYIQKDIIKYNYWSIFATIVFIALFFGSLISFIKLMDVSDALTTIKYENMYENLYSNYPIDVSDKITMVNTVIAFMVFVTMTSLSISVTVPFVFPLWKFETVKVKVFEVNEGRV